MAISTYANGIATITTTEYSCPANTTYNISTTAQANSGVFQVFLDTADMVVGDQLQIRIYEKCRSVDTQRIIYECIITGTMADTWVSPSLILLHGWDVALKTLAGTSIIVSWSIRQVA